MYISDAIGKSTNDKGNFAEYILYDYYYSQNFHSYLLRKNDLGEQRIGEENDIVMPDLILKDSNDDPFFVESKSCYPENKNDMVYFSIRNDIEKTYKKFYKNIFPSIRMDYENYIPTLIVFSKIWHNNINSGSVISYFMRMIDLSQMKYDVTIDRYGREQKTYSESEIGKCSYDIQKFKLGVKEYNKTLSFEFNDDIMNTERNVWLAPNEKSLLEDIKNNFY